MLRLTEERIYACIEQLKADYRNIYGNLKTEYKNLIVWVANMALKKIATSNDLYHDLEHTIIVTLIGQEILWGKYIHEGSVSREDWLHCIISWLCHDIGYVKGICPQDRDSERLYATGIGDEMISLPLGSTDATLAPYHVDRGKLFVEECFRNHPLVDVEVIKRNIESTRFPVPTDEEHKDTINYPSLIRSADLIAQLGDPQYLQKMTALFYGFEETKGNQKLGCRHPEDLPAAYLNFFWNFVYPDIKNELHYLQLTLMGQQFIDSLFTNVFVVEEELEKITLKQQTENSGVRSRSGVREKWQISWT